MVVAALLAFTGCSTVKSDGSTTSQYPKNSIVIRNNTPYRLQVFRNMGIWTIDNMQNEPQFESQIEVAPYAEYMHSDATTQKAERIKLCIWATATKKRQVGCLRGFDVFGKHHFKVNLGTNSPPIIVTIKSKGFSSLDNGSENGLNRRSVFQLCAGSVGPPGFGLVLSTA